jgi:hybrid cluster-associated redox disulfide protein
MKITKTTTLEKILEKSGAEEILAKHGVPCIGCPMAKFEISELKIGDVCKMYGINIEKLLKDLNRK